MNKKELRVWNKNRAMNVNERPGLCESHNPNYCYNGYGQQMLQVLCLECERRYPQKTLYLEVRTWNERAIACYRKAGFEIQGEAYELETGLGKGEFYRMIKR